MIKVNTFSLLVEGYKGCRDYRNIPSELRKVFKDYIPFNTNIIMVLGLHYVTYQL